jgi:hypothetical protein
VSDYRNDEERLKDTFDITTEKGDFADWKAGLSVVTRNHISEHDMATLERAFLETQLRMAAHVERTIASRVYSADDIRMMYQLGQRSFPWAKKKKRHG